MPSGGSRSEDTLSLSHSRPWSRAGCPAGGLSGRTQPCARAQEWGCGRELRTAHSTPHGPRHVDVLSLWLLPGAAVTLQAATLVAFPGASRGLSLISAPPSCDLALRVALREIICCRLLRIVHMSQNLPACVGVCPAHVGEMEEIVCSLNQIMCAHNLQANYTCGAARCLRPVTVQAAAPRRGQAVGCPHAGTAGPHYPVLCRARLGTCPDQRPPPR